MSKTKTKPAKKARSKQRPAKEPTANGKPQSSFDASEAELAEEALREMGGDADPESQLAESLAEEDPFAGAAAPEDPAAGDMAKFEKVAARFKHWRPAAEVLTKVRAVPTIFPQYDRATRVGGHPIERWTTVHGPSNHGKTTFLHGLGASFLQRGHLYGYVDAEMTTPETWLQTLMEGYSRHPYFLAKRPNTYEETVNAVREFVDGVAAMRRDGELPDSASGLVVVDSLRKLVPEDIIAKIKRFGAQGEKGSVDGMGGRAAQIKAAMHAAWLDELTPRLYHTHTAMVGVTRETKGETSDGKDGLRLWGDTFKVGGGEAIIFDASLVLRVTRDAWVYDGADKERRTIGERHRIVIYKTKVAGREQKVTSCWFHTSNGALVPEGFDRARDVLEMAKGYGIVTGTGWMSWKGMRWQGDNAAVKKLHERPDALADLEAQVRARFAPDEELPGEEAP